MSKLYSSHDVEYVLHKLNFRFISQKGSHGKYKNEKGYIAIVPVNKKEIPPGTFRSILKQMQVDLEKFKTILKN